MYSAADVPADLVGQITEMGIGRNDAVYALQRNDLNLEKSIDYIFNGELNRERSLNSWDENAWMAGSVDKNDNEKQAYSSLEYFDGRSRPPSPTESEAMEKALQNSLNDLRNPQGVEDSQNASQQNEGWQLSGPVSTADLPDQEIYSDPPPSERIRQAGAPVLLKASAGCPGLGSLLTIFHSIPLARKHLLEAGTIHDYPWTSSWWSGNAGNKDLLDGNFDILRDTQCLMAFLDGTQRAYGSIESLRQPGVAEPLPSTFLGQWLGKWKLAATEAGYDHDDWMSSVAVQINEQETMTNEFYLINFLSTPVQADNYTNWYDLVDELFWQNTKLDVETFLSKLSDVFVCSVQRRDSYTGSGVNIPLTWAADRYMQEHKDTVSRLRRERYAIVTRISEIDYEVYRLSFASKECSSNDLLESAIDILSDQENRLETHDSDDLISDAVDAPPQLDIVPALKRAKENISVKLEELSQQRNELMSQLYSLNIPFREADADYKLHLRGIIPDPYTAFFLHQPAESALLDTNGQRYSWWCTSTNPVYLLPGEKVATGQLPVIVRQSSQEEALRSTQTSQSQVVLVYASERACQEVDVSINQALLEFVANDTHAFREELDGGSAAANEASTNKSESGVDGSIYTDTSSIQEMALEI